MKSLAVTIVVNLVLSSSSTVVGMPHAHKSGLQGSRTPYSNSVWHTLHQETAPNALKRRNNMINQKTYHGQDVDKDKHKDEDDEDVTCDSSSDAENRSTPNLHPAYKIALNSTAHPSKSKSAVQNSSFRPSEGLSKSHSYALSKEKGSENGYHGKATFFSQGGSAGACGKVHQDSDYVVAIQSKMYSGGKFCGKTVVVTRKSTGQSITCLAVDECPSCPTDQSLDLSEAAFNALGTQNEGVFDIHWRFMD